jgi:SLT domain-containing protein
MATPGQAHSSHVEKANAYKPIADRQLLVAEAVAFTGVWLMGHPQVTDAYLLGLAIRRSGVLATLDQRIAALTEPKSAERKTRETAN